MGIVNNVHVGIRHLTKRKQIPRRNLIVFIPIRTVHEFCFYRCENCTLCSACPPLYAFKGRQLLYRGGDKNVYLVTKHIYNLATVTFSSRVRWRKVKIRDRCLFRFDKDQLSQNAFISSTEIFCGFIYSPISSQSK